MLQRSPIRFGEVTMLMVSEGEPHSAAKRGTVLAFHGLGASKDTHEAELERFARAGFVAIGVDAVRHGDRVPSGLDRRFSEPGPIREKAFLEVVTSTLQELPDLIAHLEKEGLVHDGKLGLWGVSMGGYIAYAAAPMKRARAIVTVIASPKWKLDVPEHPMRHLAEFPPVALLSQIALQDEVVAPEGARALHAQLKSAYASTPERLALIEYPESEHMMREEDWEAAMEKSVEWFQRYL